MGSGLMSDSPQPDGSGNEHDSPLEEATSMIGYATQIRGEVVYAAVELGIIDYLFAESASAEEVAAELDLDAGYTLRLLRALVAYDVLEINADVFSLTELGRHFASEHWPSLRDYILYFYSPTRRAAVQYLPEIVSEGGSDGYTREFGRGLYEYCDENPEFASRFNGFQDTEMGSTTLILDALESRDFSQFETVCDVGGGYGIVVTHLLKEYPHLSGIVLDRPSVTENEERHWAPRLGVEDRCTYVGGDMFKKVPTADAYLLKAILHNWDNDECVEILSNITETAPEDATVFVIERVRASESPSELSARLDMWMMMETGGAERSRSEFEEIFSKSGLRIDSITEVADRLCILECSIG